MAATHSSFSTIPASSPRLSAVTAFSCVAFLPLHAVVNHAAGTKQRRSPPSSSPGKTGRRGAPPPSVRLSQLERPSLSNDLSCEHFHSCSGCTHEFNLHHPDKLGEVSSYLKSRGIPNFTFHPGRLWGWRYRAKLAVRGSSRDPSIGIYEEGFHDVVDIPKCKAHHPNINVAAQLLKQGISELEINPYDEEQASGELRYVQMSVSTHETKLPQEERYRHGRVQVTLVWNSTSGSSDAAEKLKALAHFLWTKGGPESILNVVHSVWGNFQTSNTNGIFGNEWSHVIGPRDFWGYAGGIDVHLSRSSYTETNIEVFDALLWRIQRNVPSGSSVSDLYAGSGVIGLSLSLKRNCKSVRCVEMKKELKASFEKMARRLHERIGGSVTWHCANVSKDPVYWLLGSDAVIVSPPRGGLDGRLLRALCSPSSAEMKARSPKVEKRPWVLRAQKSTACAGNQISEPRSVRMPETLIYVSRGWGSFRKDCDRLLGGEEWELKSAHGFNFFPGTSTVQLLVVFRRR